MINALSNNYYDIKENRIFTYITYNQTYIYNKNIIYIEHLRYERLREKPQTDIQ